MSYIKGREKWSKWYVDTAVTIHLDFKLHTEATLKMGKGAIISLPRKQKLNTKIIMEAELVGTDDASIIILQKNFFNGKTRI